MYPIGVASTAHRSPLSHVVEHRFLYLASLILLTSMALLALTASTDLLGVPGSISHISIITISGISVLLSAGKLIYIAIKFHKKPTVQRLYPPTSEQVTSLPLLTLDTPPGDQRISIGQGEYIVFHEREGEREPLSPELFAQVYAVIQTYSPTTVALSGNEHAIQELSERPTRILERLRAIDSTLCIAFIPKTLYELIYLRQAISEDVRHNSLCPLLQHNLHHTRATNAHFQGDEQAHADALARINACKIERACWHLNCFDQVGATENEPGMGDIAYRLNQLIVEELQPTSEGFTFTQLSSHAEKEITFLATHYQTFQPQFAPLVAQRQTSPLFDIMHPGPTVHFAYEQAYSSIRPMGIRRNNGVDAQIIKNALALECSEQARQNLLIYRGGNFMKDGLLQADDRTFPIRSLSFGSSLFAGVIFDGGATAYHYLRTQPQAYAIPIPFTELVSAPFYIPPASTIPSLLSHGEFFHIRTKIPSDCDISQIHRVHGFDACVTLPANSAAQIISSLPKQECETAFQAYKQQAIQLK